MKHLRTAHEYGSHFSGLYVSRKPASGRHADMRSGIIIDMDESLWIADERKNREREDANIASYRHANRLKRNLIGIASVAASIGVGITGAFIPLAFMGVYTIPSASMENTLMIGDRIAITRAWLHDGDVDRGDVIVFKDPAGWLDGAPHKGNTLIKRVIGVPGDTVEAGADGKVKVNGKPLDETGYVKGGTGSDITFKVKVSEGNVFVMGDNRENSADSRYHTDDGNDGLVPIADIIGRTEAVYWPLTDMRFGGISHPLRTIDGNEL